MRLTTSTNWGSRAAPARITSQPTIAIVRCSTWSARNRMPGQGVHATAQPRRRRLSGPLDAGPRLGLGLGLGPPRRLDLPAVDDHVRDGDHDEVDEPAAGPTRARPARGTGPRGIRARRAPSSPRARPSPCSSRSSRSGARSRRRGGRTRARSGRGRCRSRGAPRPDVPRARRAPRRRVRRGLRGTRRSAQEDRRQRPGEAADVPDARPVRDHRDRGAAHLEPVRGLRPPQVIEQDQAGDLALARRQARPAARAAAGRARRAARPPRHPRYSAMSPSRWTRARPIASRATRNAGPVRSVAGPEPGSTSPGDDRPAQRRARRAAGRRAGRRGTGRRRARAAPGSRRPA